MCVCVCVCVCVLGGREAGCIIYRLKENKAENGKYTACGPISPLPVFVNKVLLEHSHN